MGALRTWSAIIVVIMLLAVGLISSSGTANQESMTAIRMVRSDPGTSVDTPVEQVVGGVTSRSAAAWTVIVYLAGDNNLGTYMENDLAALTSASSNSDIKILALFDKSSYRDTKAYYLTGGAKVEIPLSEIYPTWQSELNMGDPNTLVRFATYCTDNYPSQRYLVVPQDHGGAWQGCCWDDGSGGDRLTLGEIGSAFEAISSHIGRKVDVVLFNDCLMSNLEVLFQVQDSVSYAVASESIGWTNNWDDEWTSTIAWMKADPGRTGQELAEYLVEIAQLTDDADYVTQSVAAINMTKVSGLVGYLDQLSDRLIAQISIEGNDLLEARASCQSFEGPYIGEKDRLIDLYQLLQNLRSSSDDAMVDGLCADMMDLIGPVGGSTSSLVQNHRATSATSFSHGISIYFPSNNVEYELDYVNGNDMASSTSWDELIIAIRQYVPPNDAIRVDSDADLAHLVALNGWDGRGTSSDPYHIQGQRLVGIGKVDCIYLGNVSKYVLVEDCSIQGLSLDLGHSLATGISIVNCSHVRIEQNSISGCNVGVSVQNSPSSNVWCNNIIDASIGIRALGSDASRFSNNTIIAAEGVRLTSSDLCVLNMNTITSSGDCLVVGDSLALEMSYNTMVGGGVWFEDLPSIRSMSISERNSVNGLALSIMVDIDLEGQDITFDAGQVILANITNGRIAGVDRYGSSTSVMMFGCSDLEIIGCTISGDKVGLSLLGCTDITLERNTFTSCQGVGLLVNDSSSIIIRNNTFLGNSGYGVDLTGCTGCIVSWNNFLDNNGAGASYDPSHAQAYDSGSTTWSMSGRGNHWSDLQGPDSNGDGLVDVEYDIAGGATDARPLVHSTMTNGLHIDSDAELLVDAQANGWAGSGSESDPILIPGLDIMALQDVPVFIGNVTLHVRLENLHIVAVVPGSMGASLFNSGNLDFCNGSITGFETAILMADTWDISFTNLSMDGGVRLLGDLATWGSLSFDPMTKVNGQQVMYLIDQDMGGASVSTEAGQVILVNVTGLKLIGQSFLRSSSAIQMAYCDQILVQDMSADGGVSAIFAKACNGLQINDTTISNCSSYGITLKACSNGLMFNNDLIDNNGAGWNYSFMSAQAFDDGLNDWNGAKRGNHWSDWTYPDLNNDRLVDLAYLIAGGSNADDRPLVLSRVIDIEPPEVHIISPASASLFPSSSFTISWTVHDNESALSDVTLFVDGAHYSDLVGLTATSVGPLTDGPHQISIVATDHDGNQATRSISITMDALGPTITWNTPQNNSAVSSATPTLEWVCSDAGTYVASTLLCLDGDEWISVAGAQYSISGLAEGWHEIWLNVTDATGHSTLVMQRFLVDTVLPDLRLEEWPTGTIVRSNATIRWSSWDNQSGLVWTGIKVDNGPWAPCSGPGVAEVRGLQDGRHTITLAVRDSAGNVQSKVISFMSDSYGPSLSFLPDLHDKAFSNDVNVSWTGHDAGSQVVRYEVMVDSGVWADMGMATSISLAALEEGPHTLTLRAWDANGWASEISGSFMVDKTAPQMEFISPWPSIFTNEPLILIEWEEEQGGSPVSYLVSLDGAAPIPIGSKTTFSLSLEEGTHLVTLTAIDLAGNEASRSITVTYDHTAPDMVEIGPQGNECELYGRISFVPNEALKECMVSLDGVSLSVAYDGRSWSGLAVLAPGVEHNVTVIAKDLSGNIALFQWSFGTTKMTTFYGQILDLNGDPISGAIVTAGDYSCVTGEHGEFVLAAPYDIGKAEVTADGKAVMSIDLVQRDLGAFTMSTNEPWPLMNTIMVIIAVAAIGMAGWSLMRARRRQ